jgi:hypothetical protein
VARSAPASFIGSAMFSAAVWWDSRLRLVCCQMNPTVARR